MDPTVLNNQGLSFKIKDWTLDAYRRVLENEMIWRGFLNSFLYSLAFTVISVFVTLLAAYPLSKKEFVGRKVFNIILLITMFFGGGMIPTSILINGFGEGYGDTGDHFAVTDEGKVIYTTVQEGYKEGIEWLHKLLQRIWSTRKHLHKSGPPMWQKERTIDMVFALHGILQILITLKIMLCCRKAWNIITETALYVS